VQGKELLGCVRVGAEVGMEAPSLSPVGAGELGRICVGCHFEELVGTEQRSPCSFRLLLACSVHRN
jgi:hypothetical protein